MLCVPISTTKAQKAFWLADVVPGLMDAEDADAKAARQKVIENFQPIFGEAIDLLPNLHTFISRPMPSSKIINQAGSTLCQRACSSYSSAHQSCLELRQTTV